MNLDSREVARTIEAIYAAAASPGYGWDEALAGIAEVVNSRWVLLMGSPEADGSGYRAESWGVDPATLDAYREHYWSVEPWRDLVPSLAVGSMNALAEAGPLREFEPTEYFADFWEPAGAYDSLLGIVDRRDERLFGLVTVRGRRDAPFEPADRDLGRIFLPHLRRALQIERALRMKGIAGRGLDGLERAVALLDPAGRLVAASERFQGLFDDGSVLRNVSGRIALVSGGDREAWQRHLDRAREPGLDPAKGTAEWFPARDRQGRSALALRALPLLDPSGLGVDASARIVVEAVDPALEGRPAADPLRALFGLTPREVRVAEEIARGRSPHEIAEHLEIRPGTVRVHLRQVYQKTGARKQAELASLVWRTTSGLIRDGGDGAPPPQD